MFHGEGIPQIVGLSKIEVDNKLLFNLIIETDQESRKNWKKIELESYVHPDPILDNKFSLSWDVEVY